jgi:hypothetical protein
MKAGSTEFGIHPGDNTLVGKTEIQIFVYADNQVFVDLNTDNGGRPDNFPGHGDILG